jgi:hypothetical protein
MFPFGFSGTKKPARCGLLFRLQRVPTPLSEPAVACLNLYLKFQNSRSIDQRRRRVSDSNAFHGPNTM